MPSLQGVDGGCIVSNNDNLKYMAFPLLQVCLMLRVASPASIAPPDLIFALVLTM